MMDWFVGYLIIGFVTGLGVMLDGERWHKMTKTRAFNVVWIGMFFFTALWPCFICFREHKRSAAFWRKRYDDPMRQRRQSDLELYGC